MEPVNHNYCYVRARIKINAGVRERMRPRHSAALRVAGEGPVCRIAPCLMRKLHQYVLIMLRVERNIE